MNHDDLPIRPNPRRGFRTLSIVAGVNAVAALVGGIALMTGGLDLGADLNARLPLASPTLAGIALVAVVAAPLGVLAVAAGTGRRRTREVALVAGILLLCWIVAQVAVLRAFSVFQPLYLGVAAYLIAASHRLRLGPATSGALLVVSGSVGVAAGAGLTRHLVEDGLSITSVWAVVLVVVGLVGVVGGARVALRRRGSLGKVAGVVVSSVVVAATVWLVAPPVAATHVPATTVTATPARIGATYESVSLTTGDDVRLAGWYLPGRNHAAVVLLHGAGSTRSDVLDQAEVLVRSGYGVLAVDARGHGDSGGTAMDFGWYGDRDVAAGVDFLAARPEVDADRIGVVGFSMGGEEAIGAAGADHRIRAVVAEGVTARRGADKAWYREVYGVRGRLQLHFEKLQTAVTAYLSGASPPTPLRAAIEKARGAHFLLVTAGNVTDEGHAAAALRAVAPARVRVWQVNGADHAGGYRHQPERWRRQVVGFLDANLADRR